MKPLRILVDSFADEGLPNAQMGNAREIIRRLDPERFEVSVFGVGNPDPSVVQRSNTRLIPLPRRRQTIRILREFLFGSHQILFYVKPSPAAKWYFKARHSWKDRRVTVGTVESRSDMHREPTVTAEAVRMWEATVLRCDFLYSNSDAVRESLQQEYGRSSEIVPTGVDTQFFSSIPKRPPNSRPKVLFVGSLRPFKQPQVVLDAASRFPSADFVLAGDGIMAAELKQRIDGEKLSNVLLAGLLDSDQLRTQYQSADVFLFPSTWEGSPKVILEAAACGLPVIARSEYRPETVVNGRTGYVVTSNDELMQRLGQLLSDAELRGKLGTAGRQHAERYDWDTVTRRWDDVFTRLHALQVGGGRR